MKRQNSAMNERRTFNEELHLQSVLSRVEVIQSVVVSQ